jgi:S1/P1 Nuclease
MQFTAKMLKVLVCAVLALVLSGPALARNDRGHMTAAYIAYKQLTPTTRDRVNALLKLNPKYNDWSATVEAPGALADDQNLMIFMIAATWADGIKRDSTYTQEGSPERKSAGWQSRSRKKHRLRRFADAQVLAFY